MVGDVSVYDGCGYFAGEGFAFEGRPLAFVVDIVFVDLPLFVWVEQEEVGVVAFVEVASFLYFEALGWGMAHLFDDFFEGDFSFLVKLEHDIEGVLDEGQAGWCFEVGVVFFVGGVWCVVGCDDV